MGKTYTLPPLLCEFRNKCTYLNWLLLKSLPHLFLRIPKRRLSKCFSPVLNQGVIASAVFSQVTSAASPGHQQTPWNTWWIWRQSWLSHSGVLNRIWKCTDLGCCYISYGVHIVLLLYHSNKELSNPKWQWWGQKPLLTSFLFLPSFFWRCSQVCEASKWSLLPLLLYSWW